MVTLSIIKPRFLLVLVAAVGLTIVATTVIRDRFFVPEPVVAGPAPAGGALDSAILGERREYLVHLPQGYDANAAARYPVLYVLDGLSQSGHSAETAALLARVGSIPPIIVVGIPNVSSASRNRDLTPPDRWGPVSPGGVAAEGGERFLSFLARELIPHIESRYRVARPRMLAGWSRGGLFVLYSQTAAPAMFDARFAHSPFFWEDADPNVGRFERGLRSSPRAETFLFLSLGELEAEETTRPFRNVLQILGRHAPPGLRSHAELSRGGDHNSNPRLSTPVGLWMALRTRPGGDSKGERSAQRVPSHSSSTFLSPPYLR